jgi:hypothetical protein
MDSFIWPLAEMTKCWMACLNVTKEGNCMAQSGCSKSHACYVLQPKWTCTGPSLASWYNIPSPKCCTLLQDKVRLTLHWKQPELLEHGIILLHDNALVFVIMVCKIWCNIGAERCWHFLPTLQISPHMITGCLHIWKNIFGVKDFNKKMMSALLSLPP